MSKRLNTGGSQGEPIRSGAMPFFFSGVKAVELITKNVYGVRILPAFQRDDAGMPTSLVSVRPYRDAANLESSTSKPAFTDWYYSLKGYKFIGNEGRGFLSPLVKEKVDHRGIDPLFDCYHLARNSKDSNPAWYDLTEKSGNEKNATLEKYRVFCAFNCLMQVDNAPVNRLGVVPKVSLDDLKDQLDVLCSRADQPNDPDWPDFMLGDITSPYHGLWGTVQKGVFNKAGMETSMFSFSRAKDRLVNVVKYPVDPASSWGQEVLAARFDIQDTERVTKVSSAEEILEFLVNDGFLPIELIREACSPFWDIPEVKGRRLSAPRAHEEASSDTGGGSFASRPAAAATAPAQTTTAASFGRQFWILMPGGQVSPKAMPESVLRSMVNQFKQDFQVVLEGETAWKTASAFGITVPAPASAPPPAPPAHPAPTAAPPPPPAANQAPPPPPRPVSAPAVPPAARIVAPGAPPSAGGVPPIPPPGGSVPPPPPARPAPVQPAAPTAPAPPTQPVSAPSAPAPTNFPVPPVTPAVSAAVASPLTQAEREELATLEAEWIAIVPSGVQMDGARIARFCELSDRASATVAKG